ncbi:MAG TPA: DUF3006 domain-containing protein [Candidatus Rifleibacterium sp.]|nr:DUF3006 domain-containing protein [Candidatus Rifleibacterium sp.]HPT47372.1 DUF3006 domain-containing protein [Candidatus Rifleibacterium sp.]
MQAVVDSMNGDYFRCLLENGDIINIHRSALAKNVEVGDVITVSFARDDAASLKQKELMK